jgi:hypothetical protein
MLIYVINLWEHSIAPEHGGMEYCYDTTISTGLGVEIRSRAVFSLLARVPRVPTVLCNESHHVQELYEV